MSHKFFVEYDNVTITVQIKKNLHIKDLLERVVERFNKKQANLQLEDMSLYEEEDSELFEDDKIGEILSNKQKIYLKKTQQLGQQKTQQPQPQQQQQQQQQQSQSQTQQQQQNVNPQVTISQVQNNTQQQQQQQSQQQNQNTNMSQISQIQQNNSNNFQNFSSTNMLEEELEFQQLKEKQDYLVQDMNILGDYLQCPINSLEKVSDSQELEEELDQSEVTNNQTNFEIHIIFPQTQHPSQFYKFAFGKDKPFSDFSKFVSLSFGYADNTVGVFYFHDGLPISQNLKTYYKIKLSDLLQNKQKIVCIFNKSKILSQLDDMDPDQGSKQIFVKHVKTEVIRVDLNNTVLQLKQKVQKKSGFPATSLNLSYQGKIMKDELDLSDYNVQADSTLHLNFIGGQDQLTTQNLQSKGIEHQRPVTTNSLRELRSVLYVLAKCYRGDAITKILGIIRDLSYNNTPLVKAMYLQLSNHSLNFCEQIAIEEGLFMVFSRMLSISQSQPKDISPLNLFKYSYQFFGVILEYSNSLQSVPGVYETREHYKSYPKTCQVTYEKIKNPVLLSFDQMKTFKVCDLEKIQKYIEDNRQVPNNNQMSSITYDNLFQDPYITHLYNNSDLGEFILWQPKEKQNLLKQDECMNYFKLEQEWSTKGENYMKTHDNLKKYSPLDLKNCNHCPCLSSNSDNETIIYLGKNKDPSKPIKYMDIITGIESDSTAEEIANPGSGGGTQYSTVQQDTIMSPQMFRKFLETANKQLSQPKITRDPEEAIIVMLDISLSMNSVFASGLQRIGAVKAFFSAFADRTQAYNFPHVISLLFFNHMIYEMCGFTELFEEFKKLVNTSQSNGYTAMYDCLDYAVDKLQEFKLRYPNVKCRIIALTDGEDTMSTKTTYEAISKRMILSQIVLDSFVVGGECSELKAISKLSGGKCFYPQTLDQGIKFFEIETILSTKNRKKNQNPININDLPNLLEQNQQEQFDQKGHQMELPKNLEKSVVQPKQIITKVQQQNVPLSQRLQRIMKELQNLIKEPHPNISVWPCQEDNSFWKLILVGSKGTPYHQGKFILYLQFGDNYPYSPPDIRFVTQIYHCNINSNGRICHSILDRNYKTNTTVKEIFDAVYGLLLFPEPEDPLDSTIASQFLSNKQEYTEKAQEITLENATMNNNELATEILGQGDDKNMQKKQEILEWINITLQREK